jgi:hypothetical protein
VSAVHDYVLTPAKFIGGGLNVLHPTLSFSSETSCPPTLSFSSETSCPPTLPFFSEENDNQGGALGHGCGWTHIQFPTSGIFFRNFLIAAKVANISSIRKMQKKWLLSLRSIQPYLAINQNMKDKSLNHAFYIFGYRLKTKDKNLAICYYYFLTFGNWNPQISGCWSEEASDIQDSGTFFIPLSPLTSPNTVTKNLGPLDGSHPMAWTFEKLN